MVSYRPPKVERQSNRSAKSATVHCAERIGPQHRCHGTSKNTVTWRHYYLVVLQAHAKESPAVGFARVPICQQSFVIFKFMKVELKYTRSKYLKGKR